MRWLAILVLGAVVGWPEGLAMAQDERADLEELRDLLTLPPEEVVRSGRGSLPFTEEQIRFLGSWMRDAQEATERAGNPPAEGRIRRLDVDSGEASIPEISVRWGYATALSFVDLTGAPWPIDEVVVDSAFLPEAGADEAAASGGGVSHVLYWCRGGASCTATRWFSCRVIRSRWWCVCWTMASWWISGWRCASPMRGRRRMRALWWCGGVFMPATRCCSICWAG